MSTTSVPTAATPITDRGDALATLALAFAADPVMRWTYPDSFGYLTYFPQLVDALGGGAFDADTADQVEGRAGVALWMPPGAPVEDDQLVALLVASVDPSRHKTMFAFLSQVQEHHPEQPHWYLPFMGVETRSQGRGLGSVLLRHGLARADRDGLPAYLEASSPRNRALYERHGFRAVAEIQAGDSPPLWPMWRDAR